MFPTTLPHAARPLHVRSRPVPPHHRQSIALGVLGSDSPLRLRSRSGKHDRFQTRTSTVFEGFISPIAVGGDSPEEIARAVALQTERGTGTGGRTPGFMDKRFGQLIHAGDHLTPGNWDAGFRTQTGQNINVAANGIAKLLRMMIEEDD